MFGGFANGFVLEFGFFSIVFSSLIYFTHSIPFTALACSFLSIIHFLISSS